jgi:NDP-sugar pyrophosphorylase family protein
MDMLHSLFPGLEEWESLAVTQSPHQRAIPNWEDRGKPWSILSDDENGLSAQIIQMASRIDTEYLQEIENVIIHPSASIGECVRIEGPCFIGANSQIRHSAYLRGGSWICEGAVVGHSTEIKNSILLPNSKAPHFNYIGDSIVGFDANLGAGAKLSNVRNDKREIIISLSGGNRVNTGLKKMGAMVGDGSQIGCNVVTNPGAIIAPDSLVGPNETITGWFET